MSDGPGGADLYDQFVERYFEVGEATVERGWPEDVRERCLFFLKMVEEVPAVPAPGSAFSSAVFSPANGGEPAPEQWNPGALPPLDGAGDRGDRYVIEREIARGGMGRVLLAYDRDLRRRVAMKVLPAPARGPFTASRFLEEAQATAQLEHPNIGPVYDAGREASGQPYFTMKWIRGRNLEEILRSGGREFTLVRLVQILQQAAMGVDFAHSRGVIHRDLKPQNVMVGNYGEVLVMDWGLAKVLRQTESAPQPVSTTRREAGVATLDGAVQGSVPYMAPEQALGEVERINARTDVFGLGAILYRILAGTSLYPESDFVRALERARLREVVPPSRCSPGGAIPPALEAVCLRALERRPEDRYPSAREFHDELQRWIEGIHDAERRAQEVQRLLREAERVRDDLRASEKRAAELLQREEELRSAIPDFESEEKKEPLWTAVAETRAAREESERLSAAATTAYRAVLSIDPGDHEARAALAEIYFDRMQAAEARGELEAVRLYEGLVRQYQDGRYEMLFRENAPVRLETDPPGAEVLLSRYLESGILLVESPPERLGVTPLDRTLPRGSYLAVLRKPGYAEARYPFTIDRGGPHRGSVRLHPQGTIPEGFVQVPAGESIVGGDPELSASLPRSRRPVDEFFIARFPVTFEEYCRFLDERLSGIAPGDEESFRTLLVPSFGREQYVVRDASGSFAPIDKSLKGTLTMLPLDRRAPVMGIPHEAMVEYCGWLGRRLGRTVRLPEEAEWERSARGADGRLFPWGNGFDWALCKGGRSRPREPFLEPVGSFPRDCSPFGVRDLAGCIREVGPGWSREGYRPTRGGSWYHPYPFVFRADARLLYREGSKSTDIGFRVCFMPA
jgi:serine/threonine-protein kinase